jgi:UDP:flavonoid glycosyltransferase YjiC (YdhE family)
MKFALAIHGTRGDVEPCAAVGLELLCRGHEVRVAVPPDMLGFVESAGLAAVAYGPDSREMHDEDYVHNFWNIQTPFKVLRAAKEQLSQVWAEMGTTLTSLADEADLLLTGMIQQGLAANVAEYYDIPLAGLHCFPVRVNGQLFPMLPSPLTRSWACRRPPHPRRNESPNTDRLRSRLTTSSASPDWQPNGRNGPANGPSSAH